MQSCDSSARSIVGSAPACRRSSCGRQTHARRGRRHGFTLLEVLIATAVTLLMMVSLAQIFKVIGDSMKQGRAALELNNRLRSVVYRVQTDLQNLTAMPDPPADPSTGTGYMKYYDGSLTDYSPALFDMGVNLSRFGDVDDIFMGTARAGDVWFTGKVPLFVLKQVEPDLTTDRDGNGLVDDIELVTIAAQHAEIVMFLEPVVTNVGNPSRAPEYFISAGPGAFQDSDNLDGSANGFPDGFRLHYRTLLVRPDLNLASSITLSTGQTIAAGRLPAAVSPTNSWLISQPQTGLPSPLCDMSAAHNQCDLSLRRVFDNADGLPTGGASMDFLAANSLEDLVDPANRFAHVQVPVPGTSSTTMPLLALGPKLSLISPAVDPTSSDPTGLLGSSSFEVGSGFLHPAYMLRGLRAGEDVLASDILAFDIKGFDPGVPLLGSTGPDGGAGMAGFDDDGVGGIDTASELGWAGTDDLVLTPNDPGYAAALASSTAVGTGEYVDLAWARKLAAHGATLSAGQNLWSPLSGYSEANFAAAGTTGGFTDGLYKSGSVLWSTGVPLVFQPAYDTWTTRYEGDGILQSFRGALQGDMRISGAAELYLLGGSDAAAANPTWRQSNVDAGTDGLDNNGSGGVDEVAEFETLPPFPTLLRGIKISIRMEDPVTRQVKQMSAAREFVTQ